MKAISLALLEYPDINSVVNPSLDNNGYIEEYVVKYNHNFSVAIDSGHGLTTPNIKNVNNKSILDINNSVREAIVRAEANTLTADDFHDGTFSISSVGNIGGKYFMPTILRP